MKKYDFPMILPTILVHVSERLSFFVGRIKFVIICAIWGVKHSGSGMFSGPTVIRNTHKGQIVLGNKVTFISRVVQSMVGITNPTILDTRWGGQIVVGDCSGFSSVVMSSKTRIAIGSRVECGANVRIFDHDFHALESTYRWTKEDVPHVRSKAITIDDDVFIGANSTILKGTHIGARSIVAAGSVLFGISVPPDSMVKGNPAVIVGHK